MYQPIEYFDLHTTCSPEDMGLYADTDDYLVISNCLYKIQRLFADDWKYRDFDYRTMMQLTAFVNKVLLKYNKQLRNEHL